VSGYVLDDLRVQPTGVQREPKLPDIAKRATVAAQKAEQSPCYQGLDGCFMAQARMIQNTFVGRAAVVNRWAREVRRFSPFRRDWPCWRRPRRWRAAGAIVHYYGKSRPDLCPLPSLFYPWRGAARTGCGCTGYSRDAGCPHCVKGHAGLYASRYGWF